MSLVGSGREEVREVVGGAPTQDDLVAIAGELLAFLTHHTGDPHLGADLAQDALAQAVSNLHTLRDREALRGWVFRIAINRFNDHVRRVRTHRLEVSAAPDREAPSEGRPDKKALARELDELMRAELLQLPDRQRTVLMLHGVRGLGQREIAELLGVSVDAVKMSLFHAREKMRERLAKYVDRSLPRKKGPTS